MRRRIFLFFIAIVFILFVAGCTKTVSEVKDDKYVGESVSVEGNVEMPVKIGKLSGYVLKDENGDRIRVSSEDVPSAGERVVVKGILSKGAFGYYIKTG